MNGNSLPSKRAQKIIIYWDYENCPIPDQATSFGNVWNTIQRRIFSYLQYEVQVEGKVYIAARKLPNKIKHGMDICGVHNIDIPSMKPEAVDKRILVDVALDLYEWKGHNTCNAVVLISGDKDFGNVLGRIHNAPEIAKLILMRLPRFDGTEKPVNKNLYAVVDYIIDSNHGNGFAVTEFIDCKYGMKCKRAMTGCKFYHHPMYQNTLALTLPHSNSYQREALSISNDNISSTDSKEEEQNTDIDASLNLMDLQMVIMNSIEENQHQQQQPRNKPPAKRTVNKKTKKNDGRKRTGKRRRDQMEIEPIGTSEESANLGDLKIKDVDKQFEPPKKRWRKRK